jgi:hypothetical protein
VKFHLQEKALQIQSAETIMSNNVPTHRGTVYCARPDADKKQKAV